MGPFRSDPESGGQVHGNGCEGFGKVIDQCPEEDVKCLRFTRLRIQGYTGTSYDKRVKHVENELRTKLESEQRQRLLQPYVSLY